uniref:SFRICE_025825 n=1 Tax=Spodoptera frugiperda TaxID=7108 RepID=A0A2H1WNG9_SPOFR
MASVELQYLGEQCGSNTANASPLISSDLFRCGIQDVIRSLRRTGLQCSALINSSIDVCVLPPYLLLQKTLPYGDTRCAPTEQCSIVTSAGMFERLNSFIKRVTGRRLGKGRRKPLDLVTEYTRRTKSSRIAVPLTMACSKKPSYVAVPDNRGALYS